MQTFLPYPEFDQSAQALDPVRLNQQVNEAKAIIQCLRGEGYEKWRGHPAVRMWEGHLAALSLYGQAVAREHLARGGNDPSQRLAWFQESLLLAIREGDDLSMPLWLGDERMHASHRSALLYKSCVGDDETFEWYDAMGWRDPIDGGYWWPTKDAEYAV